MPVLEIFGSRRSVVVRKPLDVMNCNDHEPRGWVVARFSCLAPGLRYPQLAEMLILAIVGTCRSVVGTVGIITTCSRWVLPRNVIHQVSTELDEAERLLNRAGAINTIEDESEYRRKLTIIRNEFLRMRMASHRAPGFLQQLRLLFGSALTYKLYILSSQIGAIKLQLELALDEQQLSSGIDLESGITAIQPCPAVAMAIPSTNAADTSPPVLVVVQ